MEAFRSSLAHMTIAGLSLIISVVMVSPVSSLKLWAKASFSAADKQSFGKPVPAVLLVAYNLNISW